jgi:hypothetical protein
MSSLVTKVKTAYALGIPNILQVLLYRGRVRVGASRIPAALMPDGPFFKEVPFKKLALTPTDDWQVSALYFGWWVRSLNRNPPDWHENPINGVRAPRKPWWLLSDFSSDVGDIKLVWEASRMTWLFAFVERYLAGDASALSQLNTWLKDWCTQNPAGIGANWKCGQEAGIRVMHLAMAAMLLKQTKTPTNNLLLFIEIHLKRIVPTLRYAMSQDNNHGTSEAAALYIGGTWLAHHGRGIGKKWARLGRTWLENRATRLIMEDGSFSQYSVNYHRVLLDTLSMVELWRRHLNLPPFSQQFQKRAILASEWLAAMVDVKTGDAPNLGANDGAYLFSVATQELRDFRTSVQTSMVLFRGAKVYTEDGVWNARLRALEIALPKENYALRQSQLFDKGGYAILRRGHAMTLLRYPRFRFRPSQADILHVDLWCNGENILRDAGTYSYHASLDELNYFPGTKSHNTIQFDDRDQMPRLSRFLFGDWLKTKAIEPLYLDSCGDSFSASYQDTQGVYHQRKIILSENKLVVIDNFHGFHKKAVLRWRLKMADWCLSEDQLTSALGKLRINATVPVVRSELTQGWESRYYLQKTATPVLEIEVHQPGQITTEYTWCL